MVSIKKEIYYLVDFKTQEIFVYKDFIQAREKEKEFKKKYGPRTVTLPNGNVIDDCNPINYSQKTLKHYYGTVYCLYKFTETGALHSYWEGRTKEIDAIKKYSNVKDFTLKKFVLEPYEEFKKQFESEDDEPLSAPPTALF